MKEIKKWELATNNLAQIFVRKYFGKEYIADYYWVGDDIGGVININDYFFNLDRIVEALKYKATKEKLFDYYDLSLECYEKNEPESMNFKNYLKLKSK